MSGDNSYSQKEREWAIKAVLDRRKYETHREAVISIAGELGCSVSTLEQWIRDAETDLGSKSMSCNRLEQDLVSKSEENGSLANSEFIRLVRAYFLQAELDRRNG